MQKFGKTKMNATITHTTNASLFIKALELPIYLGWSQEERSQIQTVRLDIDIHLPHPPLACTTDNLADTFCYAVLIKKIFDHIAHKNFHLLEHLTYVIHQLIKPLLPPQATVTLHLSKQPQIENFTGQVCFSYGEEK